MPTYEYECTKCGRLFELFQSMKDKSKRFIATQCDQCHNKAPVVRRIGTGGAVIFKGGGFYQTDYRSESYKEAAKKDKEAASGDKSDKKAESKTAPTSAEPKPSAAPDSSPDIKPKGKRKTDEK